MGKFNASTILTIATVAIGAFQIISAFKQAGAVKDQGKAEIEAARANAELTVQELSRQQEEVRRSEDEKVSDRIRVAKRELASITVAGLERGTGLNTLARLQNEAAFFEDLDISRIRTNADEDVAALEARKASAGQQVLNVQTQAENRTSSAKLAATLGIFSTGLQIGTTLAKDRVSQAARANRL